MMSSIILNKVKNLFKGEEKEETIKQEEKKNEQNIEEKKEEVLKKPTLQKITSQEIEAKEENKEIIEKLKEVVDPELGIDIWTLGLVYNIQRDLEKKEVHILMTFTSIMCPVGPMIVQNVDLTVKKNPAIEKVFVQVTFTPSWEPTEELREMLGV